MPRDFALYYPELQVAYNVIPKNACSTIKATLAFSSDGRVASETPHDLDQFYRTRPQSLDGWRAIVVLRDPWRRLVSAYLDKLTRPPITPDRLAMTREILRLNGRKYPHESERLSFRQFVNWFTEQPIEQTDAHWRPQTALLAFDRYDHRLRFEHLAADWARTLEPIAGALRTFEGHSTARTVPNERPLADVAGHWLHGYRVTSGYWPDPNAFHDDELFERAKRYYKEDYAAWEAL